MADAGETRPAAVPTAVPGAPEAKAGRAATPEAAATAATAARRRRPAAEPATAAPGDRPRERLRLPVNRTSRPQKVVPAIKERMDRRALRPQGLLLWGATVGPARAVVRATTARQRKAPTAPTAPPTFNPAATHARPLERTRCPAPTVLPDHYCGG